MVHKTMRLFTLYQSYRISFAAPLASGGSLTQGLPSRFRGLRLFYLSASASKLAQLPSKKADQTKRLAGLVGRTGFEPVTPTMSR
jgi:hypothetical protein